MALLTIAVGSSACVVDSDDGELVGEAEQATIKQFTAGGTAGWTTHWVTHQLYGGSQYYNSVEVDDVNGRTFTVEVTVDFSGSYILGSWTETNRNLCEAEHAWIYLSKFLNGSWVSWVAGAEHHATPIRGGNQVVGCRATFTQPATSFSSSTALNAYVSGFNANGTYTIESIRVTQN